MPGRSSRSIFGWLLDRIMWLLSFYLVVRGAVRDAARPQGNETSKSAVAMDIL
jgi:hypothetical protein